MFDRDRQAQARAVETLRGIPEVSGVAATYNLPYWGSNGDNVSLPNDERELFNVADQYECCVVNDVLEDAVEQTREIVTNFINGK